MRFAVIGSGISGLGAAYLAHFDHQVTLYEIADRIGGHSNTVDAVFDGQTIPVDTGFIVYNTHNYPNLVGLFDHLGVDTHWKQICRFQFHWKTELLNMKDLLEG